MKATEAQVAEFPAERGAVHHPGEGQRSGMIADLKAYQEYKESGLFWLDQVPNHWDMRRSKYLFREVDQRSLSGTEQRLSMSQRHGLIASSQVEERRLVRESNVGSKLCEAGDLVLNRLKAHLGVLALSPVRGLVSPDYTVFRPIGTANHRYFCAVYRSPYCGRELRQRAKGIVEGFWRLYTDDFYDIRVPLPPPSEQAAIVRFLDWANGRLERAIRAKRKVIVLLNEQKQAVIHNAVTRGLDPSVPLKPSGITWLGDIPQHWAVVPSKALFKHRREKAREGDEMLTASQAHGIVSRASFMAIEGRRVMQVITGAEILKHVEPNDFVMSMRSFQGGLEWSQVRGAISSAYVTVVPTESVYPRFFAHALKSRFYISELRRTSDLVRDGQALRFANFGQVPLPLLPVAEQRAIADFLDRSIAGIAKATSRLEREIELLREYRTRLIADVVTGKLDVREAAARLPDDDPSSSPVSVDTDFGNDSEPAEEDAIA